MNLTKTQIMEFVKAGQTRECFTHNEVGQFDVTAMRKAIIDGTLKYERHTVALDNIMDFYRTSRVIDEQRIDDLSEKSWKTDPGIMIVCPAEDGGVSHLTIDGHHRAFRREKEGETDMDFFMVELQHAIRPGALWVDSRAFGLDWGTAEQNAKLTDQPRPH